MPNWVYNYLTIHPSDKHLVFNNKTQNVDFELISPMPKDMMSFNPDGLIQTNCIYYISDRLQMDKQDLMELLNGKYFGLLFSDTPNGVYIKDCQQHHPDDSAIEAVLTVTEENLDTYLKLLERDLQANWMTDEKKDQLFEKGRIASEFYLKYKSTNWYQWSVRNWGCKWNACETRIEEEDKDHCLIFFETPWGPPEDWIKTLASYKVDFKLEWEEEQGYYGTYAYDTVTDTFTDTGWLDPKPDETDDDESD